MPAVILLAACALPQPNITAAQVLAKPAASGLRDYHYRSVSTIGMNVAQVTEGTVTLKPPATRYRGLPGPETIVAGGQYYTDQATAMGYTHPRYVSWSGKGGGELVGGPFLPFNSWSGLTQASFLPDEGSLLDAAWHVRARMPSPPNGQGSTVEVWIRQRDGYPLRWRSSWSGKGPDQLTTVEFDRFDSGVTIKPPPPDQRLPPPTNLGAFNFAQGGFAVLTVEPDFRARVGPSPAAGNRFYVVEYTAHFNGTAFRSWSWELVDVDGNAYRPASTGLLDYGQKAFFMAQTGLQSGWGFVGFELPLRARVAAVVLTLTGPGASVAGSIKLPG